MPHLSTLPKTSPLLLRLFDLPRSRSLLKVQESRALPSKLLQLLLPEMLQLGPGAYPAQLPYDEGCQDGRTEGVGRVPRQEQRLGKTRRSPVGPGEPPANMDVDRGASHTKQGMDGATRGHRPHLPISLALRSTSLSPLISPLPHQ